MKRAVMLAASVLVLSVVATADAQSYVRTDNASLSSEGVSTDNASPPKLSAGTDSGRLVKCRLVVQ